MKIELEIDPVQDMGRGVCSFCRAPVALTDGYLEFYREHDGRLHHPKFHVVDGTPVALFAHRKCAPEDGYGFPFREVMRDRVFLDHIRKQFWASPVFETGFRAAQAFVAGR